MARNSEKAQSMLFRFRAAQAADLGILDLGRTKRPKGITTIDSIPVCEKWRSQVLREISRKVSKIQDPALSDYQIRDLNDEINKLMKEKFVWELRIRELGGPNYMRGGRVVDEEGREVPGGSKGYRYFGRAKELPGVKELFEAATKSGRPPEEGEKGTTRAELSKNIDAGYYGYNLDEEDGTLLAYEEQQEREFYNNLMEQAETEKEKEPLEILPGDVGDGVGWRVPTTEEVQDELVERRRRRLLDKLG
jgi:pre-mRNA-splicing factor ISY1